MKITNNESVAVNVIAVAKDEDPLLHIEETLEPGETICIPSQYFLWKLERKQE